MSVAWTKSGNGNISFVANCKQFFVSVDDKKHSRVLEAIKEGASEDELVAIFDIASRVNNHLFDNGTSSISIEDGSAYFVDSDGDKELLHGTVVTRLISFVEEGLPTQPIVNFITKCIENSSKTSAEELFDFLDHKGLPICEDGDFLAYKAIRSDFTDKWTGKIDNSIGSVVKEKRRFIEDNRNVACARGLHAGTLQYVNGYGNFFKDADGNIVSNSDQCIIVKINPKNVVSVPSEDVEKLRCCEYKVIRMFEGELDYQLVTNEGDEWMPDEWLEDDEVEDELEEIRLIEFIYLDEEDNRQVRSLIVTEEDDEYYKGTLYYPEPNEGEFRCFLKSKMSNIEEIEI